MRQIMGLARLPTQRDLVAERIHRQGLVVVLVVAVGITTRNSLRPNKTEPGKLGKDTGAGAVQGAVRSSPLVQHAFALLSRQ